MAIVAGVEFVSKLTYVWGGVGALIPVSWECHGKKWSEDKVAAGAPLEAFAW
jgi:hypothetical protein